MVPSIGVLDSGIDDEPQVLVSQGWQNSPLEQLFLLHF